MCVKSNCEINWKGDVWSIETFKPSQHLALKCQNFCHLFNQTKAKSILNRFCSSLYPQTQISKSKERKNFISDLSLSLKHEILSVNRKDLQSKHHNLCFKTENFSEKFSAGKIEFFFFWFFAESIEKPLVCCKRLI